MMDDLIDNASIRYQAPAWHTLSDVGRNAALHSMLMENCMHFLLQKYFSKHPQYKNILEMFLNSVFYLNYGQLLDTVPYNENILTQEIFDIASFGKFGHSTFYPSFTLAMYLADIRNPELYELTKKILMKLGTWYHVQVSLLFIIFHVLEQNKNMYTA